MSSACSLRMNGEFVCQVFVFLGVELLESSAGERGRQE